MNKKANPPEHLIRKNGSKHYWLQCANVPKKIERRRYAYCLLH
jgi:hypothetical protein